MVKSLKDTMDIRYNDYLDEQSWLLSSKKKVDVLTVPIEDSPKRVTFISEIDSISFTVSVGDKYDFYIYKGNKKHLTRIEGIKAFFSKKNDSLAEINLKCLKSNLISVAERNKNYPFNKAVRIELISFFDPTTHYTTLLPVKNGQLEPSKIREQKMLSTDQINELTNILFNIGRTPVANLPYSLSVGASCYEPRNGILFINSKGRIFEYIEICFGCERNRFSSKRIKPWDDCDEKYNILRSFFVGQGIQFGTITNTDSD